VTKHLNPKLDISDSAGIAEPMAEPQGHKEKHKEKPTYGQVYREGGFKVKLIYHLFATYFVQLSHIWLESVNKYKISRSIIGR
jgi:hypothetical protein